MGSGFDDADGETAPGFEILGDVTGAGRNRGQTAFSIPIRRKKWSVPYSLPYSLPILYSPPYSLFSCPILLFAGFRGGLNNPPCYR